MARRNQHSQAEIREMVLQAAETLITEEGFATLTVRKIALEIGYTVGSIYMVFASMGDLLTHINQRTLDALAAELNTISETQSAEQQLQQMAQAYWQFARCHPQRWQLVFAHPKQTAADYLPQTAAIFSRLEKLFQALNPQQPAAEQQLAARTLWGAVHGICLLSQTGHLPDIDENATAAAVTLLVDQFVRGWRN